MILLAEEQEGVLVIHGQEAEPGETLECEGCGEQAQQLFETDDSVMLCAPCMKTCVEDAA